MSFHIKNLYFFRGKIGKIHDNKRWIPIKNDPFVCYYEDVFQPFSNANDNSEGIKTYFHELQEFILRRFILKSVSIYFPVSLRNM